MCQKYQYRTPFLAHQPSPHWKSQIAHSDMSLESTSWFIPSASPVMSRLTSSLYHHHHSHHPSLLHSFTPGSKPTFSTNPSHLRLLLPTRLPSWQWDWTGPITLIGLFLVSHFNFLFVPCGGLSWLPISFLLHVKIHIITHYQIVSYMLTKDVIFCPTVYKQVQKRGNNT